LVAAPLEDKLKTNLTELTLEKKVEMLLRPPVDGSSAIDRPWDSTYKVLEILEEDAGKGVYSEKEVYELVKKQTLKHRHARVNLRGMEYFDRYQTSSSAGEEKRLNNFYVS
jgi:hypothetical protein